MLPSLNQGVFAEQEQSLGRVARVVKKSAKHFSKRTSGGGFAVAKPIVQTCVYCCAKDERSDSPGGIMSLSRVSYNGHYVTFPRLRQEFDSPHPHQCKMPS